MTNVRGTTLGRSLTLTKRTLGILVTSWSAAVLCGMAALVSYSNKAGDAGQPPKQLPRDLSAERLTGDCTLLMFIHPRCPCSRSTIRELSRLMTQCRDALSVQVYFYRPLANADAWAHTDLWFQTAAIPHVEVAIDVDGEKARQFAARTSGYVLLYDPQGALTYSGGITAGRGHEGDNAGKDTIVSVVRSGQASRVQAPVFGCPLFDPRDSEATRK